MAVYLSEFTGPQMDEMFAAVAQLPREAKVYQDSTYRAVVSGYRPSLDTISIYQRTVFVDDFVSS